jgi:hypothetical protein
MVDGCGTQKMMMMTVDYLIFLMYLDRAYFLIFCNASSSPPIRHVLSSVGIRE